MLQIGLELRAGSNRARRTKIHAVLMPLRLETQSYLKRKTHLAGIELKVRVPIPVLGVTVKFVSNRALDVQKRNFLVRIGHRQGDPEP